jgi:hypothetical protein
MQKNLNRVLVWFLVTALVGLACGIFSPETPEPPLGAPPPVQEVEPPEQVPPDQPADEPGFGPITFCSDVNEDGHPVNTNKVFPKGTRVVYALFTYWGMESGQPWGQYWTQDGVEHIDGTNQTWEEDQEGWIAYSLEEDSGLSGEYELVLYIGSQPVQSATFVIEGAGQAQNTSTAAFGSIQFSEGITDEITPINPSARFKDDIVEVYAVFPYFNFTDGQAWSREWVYDGEVQVYKDLTWDEGTDGLTYTFFYFGGNEPFSPGTYTLNLYIEGQLARSASFEVMGEGVKELPDHPQGPANPEDIIDPNLMPAWEILYYAGPEILTDVAEFALNHHISMELSDEIKSKGLYVCSRGEDEPGSLYIRRSFWNDVSWEEVAATMAHELTHAVQDIVGGRCYCSIENEYHAYVTSFYVLQETGRMDLLEEKWRGAYDDDGYFDPDLLWAAVKEAYPECPDY